MILLHQLVRDLQPITLHLNITTMEVGTIKSNFQIALRKSRAYHNFIRHLISRKALNLKIYQMPEALHQPSNLSKSKTKQNHLKTKLNS